MSDQCRCQISGRTALVDDETRRVSNLWMAPEQRLHSPQMYANTENLILAVNAATR